MKKSPGRKPGKKRPAKTSYVLKGIDRSLWRRVKVLALTMDKSIGECVQLVLEERLKKEKL